MGNVSRQGPVERALASRNYEVGSRKLAETAEVRVWEIVLDPGERMPLHRHRCPYLWIVHAGAEVEIGYEDGATERYRHDDGEIVHVPVDRGHGLVHDLANVDSRRLVITTIELPGPEACFWKEIAPGGE